MPSTTTPVIPGFTMGRVLHRGEYTELCVFEQQHPAREVVVKLLHREAPHLDLLREADLMAAADHPYVVPVLSAGTTAEGRPYLVVPLYPGGDAGSVAGPGLAVERALRWGVQISHAVAALHAAGVLHRDIKPANVLLDAEGNPRLSDFGVAALESGGDGDAGGISLPYASPEVADGERGTTASDVYSLAATVYALLTGRPPVAVEGVTRGEAVARIKVVAPSPTGRPDVPGGLEALLRRALAKDPAHRPSTALELAEELERWGAVSRTAAVPTRTKTKAVAAAVTALVAVAAVAIVALVQGSGASSTTPNPTVAPTVEAGVPGAPAVLVRRVGADWVVTWRDGSGARPSYWQVVRDDAFVTDAQLPEVTVERRLTIRGLTAAQPPCVQVSAGTERAANYGPASSLICGKP